MTPAGAQSRPAAGGAAGALARVRRAWEALRADERLAAVAAAGLFVSMFLPWYQKQFFIFRTGSNQQPESASDSLTAFGAFSFVEAAVLLVAAGVLLLLFARAERRPFHLPGGDGTVIFAAGGWAALLLFYRLFDKPSVATAAKTAATVGVQWGFVVAFGAAGVLTYAGWRIRSANRPEPAIRGFTTETEALPGDATATVVMPPEPAAPRPEPPRPQPPRPEPPRRPKPPDSPDSPDRLF